MLSEYICHNGVFIKSTQFCIHYNNRSFKYGDGLFETIHANGTIPQFLDKHINRLFHGMSLLKMNIPDFFDYDYIFKKIQGTLVRNKLYKGARVRFMVYRNDGGLYTPESNDISFIIETTKLPSYKYLLNEKGYFIDIFSEIKKPVNYLSPIKSSNALIFVMAGLYKKHNNIDECLILNEKNNLCEAISSNIFLVKNNKVYTPPLQEGCIPGIMREILIELMKNNNMLVYDKYSLTIEHLNEADEVFLTNAIQGIQWVIGYKKRRYYNKIGKKLSDLLNNTYIQD